MKRKDDHLRYQQNYFDQAVEFFCRPIPEDVEARTAQIVESAISSGSESVLDVGTGTGVLIEHMKRLGVSESAIVACDLSANMLEEAKKRYAQVTFIQSDVDALPDDLGPFDAVFFNGCFVNMYDQLGTLRKCSRLLRKCAGARPARLVISHPMGRVFTEELQARTPDLVAHPLPRRAQLESWAAQLNMHLSSYRDEQLLYLAILQTVSNGS